MEKPKVKPGEPEVYQKYIDNLPEYDDPNNFGLNDNAQKTFLMKITSETLHSIMML